MRSASGGFEFVESPVAVRCEVGQGTGEGVDQYAADGPQAHRTHGFGPRPNRGGVLLVPGEECVSLQAAANAFAIDER